MRRSDEICRDVGHVLRNARERSNKSQQQLADACELNRGYISDIERGLRNPTVKSLDRILAALGMSWSDFGSQVSRRSSAGKR